MPDPQPASPAAVGTENAVPPAFAHARESIWRRLANAFWGYDFFVSYHWASGGAYAVALAQRLRDRNFAVFLDRGEFAMGDDWKGVGERAIRNTQRLVLIATREAVTASAAVEHELALFTSRGRQVVPIVFADDPAWGGLHSLDSPERSQYRTLTYIANSQLYIRDAHSNLARGPSDAVIRQLDDTHRVMRRRNVRALAMGLVAAILVGFSTFSTGSWIRAYQAQRNAEAARDSEKRQRENAEEQTRVATSRQLAALSALERTKQLDTSLILAVEAHGIRDTFEARDSLFKALRGRPGLRTFLRIEDGGLTSVAFSSDGKTVAAAYSHGVVLWDAARGKRFGDEPFPVKEGKVTSVAFSPDGKTLAAAYGAGGNDGGVVFWDAAAGKRLGDEPLAVKEGQVTTVAFSPDGKTVAAGYQGVFGILLVPPTAAGSDDRSLKFVPPANAGGVVLWDAAAHTRLVGEPLAVKEGHVWSVAFSPDNKIVAAGYGDGRGGNSGGVVLWDPAARKRLTDEPLAVKEGLVHSVAFSPNGKTLAAGYGVGDSVGSTGGMLLWDAATRKRLGDGPLAVKGGSVRSVAFSSDGKTVAAGYGRSSDYGFGAAGGVVFWNAAARERLSDEPLPVKGGPVTSVAFSPDGKFFAAAFGAAVLFCDATPGERLAGKPLPVTEGRVHSVAFSPDGKTVAAGYYVYASGYVGGVVLWDSASRKRLGDGPLAVKEGHVTGVAFSHDSKNIAAAYGGSDGNHGGILLWNAAAGERLAGAPLTVKEGKVHHMAFSPDGKTVAAAYSHGVVLWDEANRKRLRDEPLQLQRVEATSVAFSPDGKTVAAGYEAPGAGGVVLWDVARGTRLGDEPLVVNGGSVRSVAFSPDGKTVAAGYQAFGGSGVALWDVATRTQLSEDPLSLNEGSLQSMAFSPDGKTVAAAFGQGVVLWYTAARVRLTEEPFATNGGHISSMAFSPDGKTVAAAYEAAVVLWNVDVESWKRIAGEIANRNFTGDESRQYFPDDGYHRTFSELPTPPRGQSY